jgi:hypothetical protein
MSSLIVSSPVFLRFAGHIKPGMGAQATSAELGSKVLLQKIDFSGQTILQQWQFGNDGRIYLYNTKTPPPSTSALCLTYSGKAMDYAPLILAPVNSKDFTQVWAWAKPHDLSLKNVGASEPGGTIYAMDDNNSSKNPNNPLQIYHINNTKAQYWIAQSVLASQFPQMAK